MCIPYTLLILCSIGGTLQASDNPTHHTNSNPSRVIDVIQPVYAMGSYDNPFQTTNNALRDLEININQSNVISLDEKQTLEEYLDIFHQLRDEDPSIEFIKNYKPPWQKYADFQKTLPINENRIRSKLHDKESTKELTHVGVMNKEQIIYQLNRLFNKWRDQGIQSIINAQLGSHPTPNNQPVPQEGFPAVKTREEQLGNIPQPGPLLTGLYNTFGMPGAFVYDALTLKLPRALAGFLTGFGSSYGAMRCGAELSDTSDSVLTRSATCAVSLGMSILGNLLCKNNASFYTGYAFGMWVGDASFNAECIPTDTRTSRPYAIHNTNSIHRQTLAGPAGLAITGATKKYINVE